MKVKLSEVKLLVQNHTSGKKIHTHTHMLTVATVLRRGNMGGKESIAITQAKDDDVLEYVWC